MRRLASDTLIYGLGSVANQAVAFLLLPLYTRYLTPADYGTLALIGAAGSILALAAALGIHMGLTRIYFLYDAPEDRDAVVSTAFLFGLLSCLLMATPLVLGASLIAPLLFEGAAGPTYIRLAVPLYTLSAFSNISLGTLQVQQRPVAYIACTLCGLLVSIGLTIYLVVSAERGVQGVLEGQFAGMTVQVGLGLLWTIPGLRPAFRRRPLKQMLSFCLPLLPTSLSAWSLGLTDRYALKEYGSLTDVGLYSLGYRFGSVFDTLFTQPFSRAWNPYFFSILNDPRHRGTCARVLEYYLAIGGMLVLAIGLFGADVIRVIAAPAFFSAGKVIYWIGLAFLLRGSTFITVAGIHARQKTHYSAYAYGGGVILNLLLLVTLVPHYGMMGAAFAVVLTYGFVSFVLFFIAQRIYPIPYRLGRVGALLLLLTALFLIGAYVELPHLALRLALKLACLATFPTILLTTGFFTPAELARAREIAAGWLPRRRNP